MSRAILFLVLVACSDSKPAPAPRPSPADAAVADKAPADAVDLVAAASWIGVRLNGLEIIEVLDNTPAKEAGILAGDQLVSLYGESIESVHEFVDQIRRMPPGATIPLVVKRGGEELKLSITVASRPPSAPPY